MLWSLWAILIFEFRLMMPHWIVMMTLNEAPVWHRIFSWLVLYDSKFLYSIPGFTYQYLLLNALVKVYSPNLRVLGFPCNQFGMQEPGTNDEILSGLKYVRPGHGFVPKFPIFTKTEVNGENEDPLFTFLKVVSLYCRIVYPMHCRCHKKWVHCCKSLSLNLKNN